MTKYKLGRCETYCEKRHGILNSYEKKIERYFIFMEEYGLYDTIHWTFILGSLLIRLPTEVVRKYNNINVENWSQIYNDNRSLVEDPFFDMIHIVEIVEIEDWTTSIIKTFYLKLIQRKWKNIYKKRKQITLDRLKLCNIMYRERNGQWPDGLNYYPGLRGMLSDLK